MESTTTRQNNALKCFAAIVAKAGSNPDMLDDRSMPAAYVPTGGWPEYALMPRATFFDAVAELESLGFIEREGSRKRAAYYVLRGGLAYDGEGEIDSELMRIPSGLLPMSAVQWRVWITYRIWANRDTGKGFTGTERIARTTGLPRRTFYRVNRQLRAGRQPIIQHGRRGGDGRRWWTLELKNDTWFGYLDALCLEDFGILYGHQIDQSLVHPAAPTLVHPVAPSSSPGGTSLVHPVAPRTLSKNPIPEPDPAEQSGSHLTHESEFVRLHGHKIKFNDAAMAALDQRKAAAN